MSYSFISYSQFRAALAQRLYDSSKIFITDAELKVYSLEALQTFNAFASFYRQEFTFTTRTNVTWYDLTDKVNLPNSLRLLNTTDTSIITAIEYHLLEPLTSTYPLTWAGSSQFSVSDILNAVQQARDQTLSEANCTITESLINAPIQTRVQLIDQVIGVRRMCWLPNASPAGFTANLVLPSDIWAQQSFEAGFPQAVQGTPFSYRLDTNPPDTFDVDIVPAVSGQYDLLTINAGTVLSAAAATTMTVPDDWCWAIKWGALGQLLRRDSMASDPVRTKYALTRYQQATATMQKMPAVLACRINDVPVFVDTVANGDYYDANWQALTPAPPTKLYYSGLNLIGLAPQPNVGPYGVTVQVVRNMVLPVADNDDIQIGRDDLASVLDYAQHIAMFKVGGAEFIATLPLLDNFLRHCALYNSKLSAQSMYRELTEGLGKYDEKITPVFDKPSPSTSEKK
jgi:hypothetical protein